MSDQNSWDNEDLQELQNSWGQPDSNGDNNNRNNAGNHGSAQYGTPIPPSARPSAPRPAAPNPPVPPPPAPNPSATHPPIAGNGPAPNTPPHFAGRGAMPPAPQSPGQLNNWNFQTHFSQTGSFHNGWADALDFNDRPGGSNSY